MRVSHHPHCRDGLGGVALCQILYRDLDPKTVPLFSLSQIMRHRPNLLIIDRYLIWRSCKDSTCEEHRGYPLHPRRVVGLVLTTSSLPTPRYLLSSHRLGWLGRYAEVQIRRDPVDHSLRQREPRTSSGSHLSYLSTYHYQACFIRPRS